MSQAQSAQRVKPQHSPGPSPQPPQPLVLLTGLVVSLPRLPLLLRLPISVCELDCDIPSKKGLRRRSTARVSGHQGPEQQPMEGWVVTRCSRKINNLGLENACCGRTQQSGQGGPGPKDFRKVLSGLLSARGKHSDPFPDSWRFHRVRSQTPWQWRGPEGGGLGDCFGSGRRDAGRQLDRGGLGLT